MHIIFAPHADDEIIGCFTLLEQVAGAGDEPVIVVYCDRLTPEREAEARRASEDLGFTQYTKTKVSLSEHLETSIDLARDSHPREELRGGTKAIICWAPDPHHELHPLHREVGSLVRTMSREEGLRFGVYSTNMNAPYIQELSVGASDRKRRALNTHFPSQKGLWQHDHRYWLFEGRAEWNPTV